MEVKNQIIIHMPGLHIYRNTLSKPKWTVSISRISIRANDQMPSTSMKRQYLDELGVRSPVQRRKKVHIQLNLVDTYRLTFIPGRNTRSLRSTQPGGSNLEHNPYCEESFSARFLQIRNNSNPSLPSLEYWTRFLTCKGGGLDNSEYFTQRSQDLCL